MSAYEMGLAKALATEPTESMWAETRRADLVANPTNVFRWEDAILAVRLSNVERVRTLIDSNHPQYAVGEPIGDYLRAEES